jgi:hypothetical protein
MVMIGLFLSNYSTERACYYWRVMFPIFGVACFAHELTIAEFVRSLCRGFCCVRRFTGLDPSSR